MIFIKKGMAHDNSFIPMRIRVSNYILGLKLHTKKTVIAFVLENHRIRDKYVQKILLYIHDK